jgi:hypothetical protein
LATNRYIEILQGAVRQVPIKKKTQVSRAAKLLRLEEKKQRSISKTEKSRKVPAEDKRCRPSGNKGKGIA